MDNNHADMMYGLSNQGATCYLNSVLQVLFMTEDFREAVNRHARDNPVSECIDLHLVTLFDHLKSSKADTYEITNKLGIDNVYVQRDAAEYFEKILHLTSPEASQIFRGLLTHKTACSACCTETGTDGPFWHLPLALVDSCGEDYSVVEGIKEFFRASDFSGENQMYCEQCDAKCDTTIKCMIKNHPEVLMLLLKRFEFDYRHMTYVKINHNVDVPCTLQVPENQTYELYAVVEHFGDLMSGHYLAKIKPRDDKRWFCFSDDMVTLLDYQHFQGDDFKKSPYAYLLFYRKKNVHAADTQDVGEVSTLGVFLPATKEIDDDQRQDVVKTREREEVEGAVESCMVPEVAFSRKEETEIKDVVRVGSGGPVHTCDVYREDQGNGLYGQKEDMRENAQAGDQTEKTETFSRETQIVWSVNDQCNDSARPDDVRGGRPQEGLENEDAHKTSCNHQTHDQEVGNMHPQQISVDVQKDGARVVKCVSGDKDGKMEGDEQRGASRRFQDRDAEHQDNEGLDDVKQNMCEDQEVGQDDDPVPVSVDKQGEEERLEIDDKIDKDRMNYDDDQGNERVADSKRNMPKDDRRCKQDVHDAKREEQPKRGHDEHAQRKGTSERPQQDQNRQMRTECVTTQKDVTAGKQAKRDGEHIKKRVGSSGSSRGTENGGKLKVSTGLNEDAMERRRGSKKSKTYHREIIGEEVQETDIGDQRGSETENMIKTVMSEVKLVGIKQAGKKGGEKKSSKWCWTRNQKVKKKCNMTTGCFQISRKNADLTSDSD